MCFIPHVTPFVFKEARFTIVYVGFPFSCNLVRESPAQAGLLAYCFEMPTDHFYIEHNPTAEGPQ
jgi:hypothetical protein